MKEAGALRSMATSESSDPAGRLVVLAAFFGAMVGFGSLLVFSFGVFLKPLTSEFGWSRESVSAAFGFAAMAIAVSSPVLGRILDQHGARRVVLPCMVVFGVTFAQLSLLTPSLVHLYATFVVLGIVGNGTTQMGYSRAVSTWFTQNRGTALAIVMAGVGVGGMVFPGLAQWIITNHGWRAAYLVLGIIILVFGVPLTALFLRERPAALRVDGRASHDGSTVREGLRTRPFWILCAVLFFASIAVNGAITHLSALLTDRGIAPEDAAVALSVLGGMSLCGRLVTGRLLDRYFGPWVSLLLLVGVAAGMLLLSVAHSKLMAVMAAALIGFGLGGEADVTPYLLSRYYGLRSFSTLYGLTWTAYAMAGALGPVVMGRVFDVTGSYGPMLMWLSGLTLFASALLAALPKYPRDTAVSH